MKHIDLPACGMYVGSGIYPTSEGYFLSALYAHQSWAPQSISPADMVARIVADNQGNLAQFWGHPRGCSPATCATWIYALDELGVHVPPPDFAHGTNLLISDCAAITDHPERFGAGILRFARLAAAHGIYTTCIYTDAHPDVAAQLADLGPSYLGYDFGERFTFRFDEKCLTGQDLAGVTLQTLANDFIAQVRAHVDERRAAGWGHIMATSCNFYVDYEILGGAEVPLLEDFAFSHLNMASALSRGLYHQHGLPLWGSHLAHEHYSWIPYANPRKFDLLRAGLYLKYMSGAKIVINESGNWFVEGSLCEDSPKHDLPVVPLSPDQVQWQSDKPLQFLPYVDEARRNFHKIDYHSSVSRQYRHEISDFYDYVKSHGTPTGQPETTIAIAKGNLDLCHHRFSPNSVVAGAYALAEQNPFWYCGAPERGWETVAKTFYPLHPILGDQPNLFLSGSPLGMVDIVSFAADQVRPDILKRYKCLLFAGWNTASPRQYEILRQYVNQGGTLFISIPQLSMNVQRNYTSYGVDELVHGGDFSELCGVRVRGRGRRFYWATAPRESQELGIRFPQRFGVMETCLGDIEITDPTATILLVDDERAEPLLLRRDYCAGRVYFLNSWAYPGALDQNIGPGASLRSPGLIGTIYRHIARQHHGTVWITDDGHAPGRECDYINVSHFPECGHIYLYNIDFEHTRICHVHCGDTHERVELGPGEFRRYR